VSSTLHPELRGPSFEDNIDFINKEIAKRKNQWTLNSVNHIDYDDISQEIRLHIYQKWDTYDKTRSLGAWLNILIKNQIKNIVRNTYGNYTRPCLKCKASKDSESSCRIYSIQCSQCPLYANWERSKKNAYGVKMTLPIDDYLNNNNHAYTDEQDIDKAALEIHAKMEKKLKPLEWKLYKYLFIDHLSEAAAARKMGFKSSEKGRSAGYKQIKNITKKIIIKVKKALRKDEIDIL